MLINVLIPIIIWVFINAYIFWRVKAFFKYFRFIRIFIVVSNVTVILLFVSVLLFLGPPHKSFQAFSLFFQINFFFTLLLVFVIFNLIFYLVSDLLSILFYFIKSKIQKLKFIFQILAFSFIAIFWLLLFYGYLIGKSDFRVVNVELKFKNLPNEFNGLRILHISDLHLGSFAKKKQVLKGIEIIKQQKFDMLMFSGDLVNISSDEAVQYINEFNSIKAPMGKFAVLGIHDMSDYRKIDIQRDSLNVNTLKIVKVLEKMGFYVLRDTSLSVIRKSHTIKIAGTDNCGLPPFKCYGNIDKALKNVSDTDFTILLTHDPSLWLTEIKNKRNVQLTLSGHTHGMQLGINFKGFKWSPSKYIYPTFLGEYFDYSNVLYVNAGFGFIGFPVRLGIYPEITLIKLVKK